MGPKSVTTLIYALQLKIHFLQCCLFKTTISQVICGNNLYMSITRCNNMIHIFELSKYGLCFNVYILVLMS